MKAFIIQSSDVAACIGRHKYQSRADLIVKYLKSYSPSSYVKYSNSYGIKTQQDVANETKRKMEATNFDVAKQIKTEIFQTIHSASTSSNYKAKVVETIANVNNKIESLNLSPQEKIVLQEEMKKQVYTTIGTKKESTVVNNLHNTISNTSYIKRYLLDAYTPNGCPVPVYIGGRIDAFQINPNGEKVIVEVKNRMNRLFKRVVDYEFVQVMCYLYIHDLQNAKIVERFHEEVCEHDIAYDSDEWNRIAQGARNFVQEVLSASFEVEDGGDFESDETRL